MGSAPRWSEDDLKRHREDDGSLERDVQKQVFDWASAQSASFGALDLLYPIPNGQYRPGQSKEPGMQSGVPDLHLPVPRDPYPSLFLELKRKDGYPSDVSDAQEEWLRRLSAAGNAAVVAFGFEETTTILLRYLNGTLDAHIDNNPSCTPYA